VVDRREMKAVIANALRFMGASSPPPPAAVLPEPPVNVATEPAPQV
jgi:hypothetical protein